MDFLPYFLLIAAVLQLTFAFVTNANANFLSKLLFNVIPFFLGIVSLGYAVKLLGWF